MPKGKPANGRRLRRGEKLAILAAAAVSPTKQAVSDAFGVSRKTIERIVADKRLTSATDAEIEQASRSIAVIMLGSSARAQEKLTDTKLDSMNAYQLTLISKINADASQMLRNKPTAVVQHNSVTDLASSVMTQLKKQIDAIDVTDAPGTSVE